MQKQFLRGLWLALGFAAVASAQRAPNSCSEFTLFSELLTSQGCSLGDGFILKSFNFSSSDTGGEIGADQVNFSAFYLAGVIKVGLSGPFQTELGQTHTYSIGFLVDPPPEILTSFDSDADWGSTTAGLSTQAGTGFLIFSLCAGAQFDGDFCGGNQRGFTSSPTSPQGGVGFPATNIVDVAMFLNIADGGESNSITTETRSTLAPIPEPSVGVAAGLLGLGLLFRRRR